DQSHLQCRAASNKIGMFAVRFINSAVDPRWQNGGKAIFVNIGDNSHDSAPALFPSPFHMPANGVLSRPVFPRRGGGDQRHRLSIGQSIGINESSTLKQLNLHDREVVRCNDAIKEKRIHLVAQIFRVALKARRNKSNSAIERQRVYQRGAPDTRQPAYIVDQRVIKRLTTAEVIAKSLIRRNSSTENRLAVKTGIDVHELPETLH